MPLFIGSLSPIKHLHKLEHVSCGLYEGRVICIGYVNKLVSHNWGWFIICAQITRCFMNQMSFCVPFPLSPLPPERSVSDVVMIRVTLSSCHSLVACLIHLFSLSPLSFLHPLSSPFDISSISPLFMHHSVSSPAFKHTLNPQVLHTSTLWPRPLHWTLNTLWSCPSSVIWSAWGPSLPSLSLWHSFSQHACEY